MVLQKSIGISRHTSIFHTGYDGTTADWDDYSRYVFHEPEGVDLAQNGLSFARESALRTDNCPALRSHLARRAHDHNDVALTPEEHRRHHRRRNSRKVAGGRTTTTTSLSNSLFLFLIFFNHFSGTPKTVRLHKTIDGEV